MLLKTSPLLDIHSTISAFERITAVHVVAVKNEVKEVLYKFSDSQGPTTITAVNLPDKLPFEFTFEEEQETVADIGSYAEYLYEPNAAILKSGAFKSVGKQFKLQKLDPHSHFYTSDKKINDFPGKTFRISKSLGKEDLKKLKGSKKNIISRNHPLNAEQFKKKYGLNDGGDAYIIATRNLGKPVILLADLA